jgi:CO/xanthine dehydrogenase FAD-binding subunit
MLLNPFTYHDPKNLDEALALLKQYPDAKLLAGGTILINSLKSLKRRGLKTPAHVISLKRVKELHGIKVDISKTIVAAMVTMEEISCSQELVRWHPVLKDLADNIATTQLRNVATVGGNIASRYTWAEWNTCLLALDATLTFLLPGKKPETISAQDFLAKGARINGILTTISLDNKKNILTVYKRLSKCTDVDIPLVAVCLRVEKKFNTFHDARVVVSQGITYAQRDKKLEAFLEGLDLNRETQALLNDIPSFSAGEKLGEYRKAAIKALIKNATTDIIEKAK